MITLTKGTEIKIIDKNSGLLEVLLKQGWSKPEKSEERKIKDGKSSTTSN